MERVIIASPVTGDMAATLGKSHNCEITFLSPDSVLASSLSQSDQALMLRQYQHKAFPASTALSIPVRDLNFSSYLEPLVDPPSQNIIGAILIQSSQADAVAMQRKVSASLLFIMGAGLLAAACISFVVSGAISKPVRELVLAVRRVAGGDMECSIQATRRDEIGQLATAFNDMVIQLRHRAELKRLVDESQAATKAKSQFLANMSHEIRTPLNGVIGVANLLLTTQLDKKQRHYTELVRSSTEVLTTLINDILDFSKIEAGKLELESIDFNPRKVVEEVVELLSLKAAEKAVKMASAIGDDVPQYIAGDPNRLRQILMNLIGNAVKFTDQGQITVCLSREVSRNDVCVRFAIKDTGPGIPEDRKQRLFKSFSQVDASTTRRYGGTGLGLAISKELAELMGGTIGVESELGHGSTFWFTCKFDVAKTPPPNIDSEPTDIAPDAAARNTFSRTIRILLAEDNQINQIVATDLLANAGCKVDVVSDGQSAVQAWKNASFDLVLMDCQMPVMDGLEATREIRRLERERNTATGSIGHIPIIALTANASNVDRSRCEEAGMNGYCPKPFQPTELLGLISRHTSSALTQTSTETTVEPVVSPLQTEPTAQIDQLSGEPLKIETLLHSCTRNPNLAIKILEKFERQIVDTANQLQSVFEAEKPEELARLSHGLKGTAGIVGAESLQAILADLESTGRSAVLDSADKQLEQLRYEVDRCSAYIPQAMAQLRQTIDSRKN